MEEQFLQGSKQWTCLPDFFDYNEIFLLYDTLFSKLAIFQTVVRYIELEPLELEVCDVVCFLNECQSPMLLRETKDNTEMRNVGVVLYLWTFRLQDRRVDQVRAGARRKVLNTLRNAFVMLGYAYRVYNSGHPDLA